LVEKGILGLVGFMVIRRRKAETYPRQPEEQQVDINRGGQV